MTTKERVEFLLNLLPQIKFDENGNATNVECKHITSDDWCRTGYTSFDLNNYEYRIIPEPQTRPMTDKEARTKGIGGEVLCEVF